MSNVRRIYFLNFSWSFLVIQAVMVPFYLSKGLDYGQIAVIASVFSFCLLIFDIPTGYLADMFGHKRALVVAGLLKGLGGTILYMMPHFYGFIAAFALIGIGNSLFSGADIALLYESVGEDFDDNTILANRYQWSQFGSASSAILGGLLTMKSLDFAIAVNAALAWISFLIALSLIPTLQRGPVYRRHVPKVFHIAKKVICATEMMPLLIAHRAFLTGLLLIVVSQFQLIWGAAQIPVAWYGVLWAAHSLIGAFLCRAAARFESRLTTSTLFVASILFPVAGFLGAALTLHLGIWSLLFTLIFEIQRGLINSQLNAELNRLLPNELRAFGNSVVSFGARLLFAASAPFVGHMVDQGGLSSVLLFLGVIALAGGLLFQLAWVRTFGQKSKAGECSIVRP